MTTAETREKVLSIRRRREEAWEEIKRVEETLKALHNRYRLLSADLDRANSAMLAATEEALAEKSTGRNEKGTRQILNQA